MDTWRGNYIRAFIAIIGLALILVGVTLRGFVRQYVIGWLFIIIGIVIIAIVLYWWYKIYQKG